MAGSHRLPRRRRRRRWLIPVLVVAAVLLFLVAWVGVRGLLARAELEAALPLAERIQQEVIDGDPAAAAATFETLQAHADAAAALTSDPLWRAAEVVPFAGPNLAVVRELAAVVDTIAADAIAPLTELAGGIDPADFKPVGGVVDIQPLVDAAPAVHAAAAALAAAQTRLESLDASATLEPVADAAAQLTAAVTQVNVAVSALDRAVTLLPGMLGVDGARNTLLLFQNPAELRAGGGIPGAVALVRTEGGGIQLVQQASSTDFPHYDQPVLELPLETRGLYGDITGEYIQDVTLTPQFTIAAPLAREMFRREFGIQADAVVAIDPVALGYLLAATGPVALPTGEQLTAETAVPLLLSEVYARYPNPRDQDAFFAAAAAAVFSQVVAGDADPVALIEALARAGGEGRVLLWSAHESEQAALQGTTLAGELPVGDAAAQRFGVYLNDATGAKMDYYLTTTVAIGQAVCRQDGRVTVAVEVTLTSTAPADAATALPDYVTGGGSFGVTPGNVRTLVSVYGPPDAVNLGATSNPGGLGIHTTTDTGSPVTSYQVELAPGESSTVQVSMLVGAGFDGEVVTVGTPGVNTVVTEEKSLRCS